MWSLIGRSSRCERNGRAKPPAIREFPRKKVGYQIPFDGAPLPLSCHAGPAKPGGELRTGNLTGNSSGFGSHLSFRTSVCTAVSPCCEQFPARTGTANLFRRNRESFAETGNPTGNSWAQLVAIAGIGTSAEETVLLIS